jgi:hypothetical protein
MSFFWLRADVFSSLATPLFHASSATARSFRVSRQREERRRRSKRETENNRKLGMCANVDMQNVLKPLDNKPVACILFAKSLSDGKWGGWAS